MAKGSPGIANVMRSLGSGTKAPATSILAEVGIQNAATISKMRNAPVQSSTAKNDNETANVVNYAELKTLSDFISKKRKDSDNIIKLFPDIELAKQIYVSSVIAPKDMTSTDLLYKVVDNVFPPDIVTSLNEIVKRHVEGHYRIDAELQDILRESLFETGSYVIATIPESSIDEIINKDRTMSMESIDPLFDANKSIKPKGFLGEASGGESFSLESYLQGQMSVRAMTTNNISIRDKNARTVETGIEVYDNFEILKLPQLTAAIASEAAQNLIGSNRYRRRQTESLESVHGRKFNEGEIRSSVFKSETSGYAPVITMPTKESAIRKSVGRALRMKLPSESVIPVYAPGQPDRHIGYFVLLDPYGAPVTFKSQEGHHDGISSIMNHGNSQNQSTGLGTYLMQRAKDTLVGANREPTLTDMARIYSSIVEKELVTRLKNGIYKKDLIIGESDDIYRLMMYRSLQGMKTRMLYIPGEMITYYAYKYHENGIGKSLLDDLTSLLSTRAVVQTARVLQQIRSSINVTNVGVNLDPRDPDPEKTIEMTVGNVVKYMQFQMPIGLITQADLSEWVSRAGLRFTFEGHPGLPELKYDFTNDTIGNTLPDTDLEEDLAKRTYMAFGLSPEQVDNSLSPDFATSVLSSNALLSKRVMNTQDVYVKLLSEDARRILRYDMLAYEELKLGIKERLNNIITRLKKSDEEFSNEFDENTLLIDMTERFIDSLCIELPRPDMTTMENQLESITKAEEIIDKYLESYVSREAYPEFVSGDAGNTIDDFKGLVKAAVIREWISNNPMFKELNDMVTSSLDKEGKTTIFDTSMMHYKGFINSMLKFMEMAKPYANAASRDVENINNNESTELPDQQTQETPTEGSEAPAIDMDSNLEPEETEGEGGAVDTDDTGPEIPQE